MTNPAHATDVRRRAGWLPESQDDLESWLDGHRQRAEARGEQAALHPVLDDQEDPRRLERVPQQRRLALRPERLTGRLEERRGPAGDRRRAVPARPQGRALGLHLLE